MRKHGCQLLVAGLLIIFMHGVVFGAPATSAISIELNPVRFGLVIPVFSFTSAAIANEKGAMKIISEALDQKLYNEKYPFGRFVPGKEIDGRELLELAGNQFNTLKLEDLVRFGKEKQLTYFMVVESWKIKERSEESCLTICTWNDLLEIDECNPSCSTMWLVDSGLAVRLVDVENNRLAHFKQYFMDDPKRKGWAWGKGPQDGTRISLRMNVKKFLADSIELK